jgi:FtsH-binding integral membrane protein
MLSVFIMFVLYDTKQVQEHARLCIEADYINESLNLFLDAINLFSNIYYVRNF